MIRRTAFCFSHDSLISARLFLPMPSLLARTARAAVHRPEAAIVFLTNRRLSFLSDLGVLAVLKAMRVPVVHYVHTWGYRELASSGRTMGALVRWALRSADAVVTLGETMNQDLAWAGPVPPHAIANVPEQPPAIDPPRLRQACFLSNLIPEKGAHRMVEIAQTLCANDPDLTVVIAGAGADRAYSESLALAIKSGGFGDRITLAGAVYGEDKWRLLAQSRVLVFPSTYPLEAQPLTILEAASVGTRVVAFDVGGISDLAAGSDLIETVPAGDVAAATRATASALDAAPAPRPGIAAWRADRRRFARQWERCLDLVAASR